MLAYKLMSVGNAKTFANLGGGNFTSSASSFTATAFNIGPEKPDRVIVVCVAGKSEFNRQISGITIGGNAATLATRSISRITISGIYYLAVPTGDTADIVISFTGSVDALIYNVYAVTGWGTVSLYDSTSAYGTYSTLTASGFDTAIGGVAFMAASALASSSPSVSDFTSNKTGSSSGTYFICGSINPTAQVTNLDPVLTTDDSGSSSKVFSVASFS